MTSLTSDPILRLISELSKLPGIGEKTATRLAYFILKSDEARVQSLATSLIEAKTLVHLCKTCLTFTETDVCAICSNNLRKQSIICIVEKPADVLAIENSNRYQGSYHVLHGLLSPLDGIGPAQLHIRELLERIKTSGVEEIILALNSSVEGEATGVYLTKLLKPIVDHVTKIAHGIPVGGVLEYMDRQTIGRAIENRVISL